MPTVPAIRATTADAWTPRWAPPPGERLPAVLGRFLRWPLHVVRARRELHRLAALGDRELRDIGLYRHDLRAAAALPPGEDPTRHLAALVRERRAARLGQFRP